MKRRALPTPENNNAPEEAVDRIRNVGTDTFNSADEVLQGIQGRM
jgi:hypothetical protein